MEHGDQQPKADPQLEVERYKAGEAQILELLRATIAFEHAALRPLLLLNGGALIAALTYIGNTYNAAQPSFQAQQCYMTAALTAWIVGLLCAGLALGLGYFSQHNFLKEAHQRRDRVEARRVGDSEAEAVHEAQEICFGNKGHAYRLGAYWSGAASLVLFAIGGALAVLALSRQFQPSA